MRNLNNKRGRGLWLLVLSVAMTGCATTAPRAGDDPGSEVRCTTNTQPEHQLQLDAVDALMSRSQPYAALAKLESEGLATEHHWVRHGQLLAATGQMKQAEAVFQALAQACGSAMGHHGLGLVYLKQKKLNLGLAELKKARALAPSSSDVRNDYGYALLLTRQDAEAVFELRTAFELADGEGPVRQNLAAGYILTNDQAGLALLRDQYDLSMSEKSHAETLANNIRRLR